MMLGGGAPHPPYWPAFGRREISGASPFGPAYIIDIN